MILLKILSKFRKYAENSFLYCVRVSAHQTVRLMTTAMLMSTVTTLMVEKVSAMMAAATALTVASVETVCHMSATSQNAVLMQTVR